MNGEPARQPVRKGKNTNLILAAALVVVCAFAYWLEARKKPEMAKEAAAAGKLMSLDPNGEIETVRIVNKAKNLDVQLRCTENCKLSNPNAHWEMTAPIKFKADESNVGTFVTSITAATIVDSLTLDGDADGNLKEFGLGKDKRDDLKAVIKFKKETEPYTIYIGENTAVGDNMYVYTTGMGSKANIVRITPAFVKTNVTRDLSYWRAKRLFDFAASEVEGLTLKGPQGTTQLVRDGANWYLMPGKLLADNEAVDTYLTGLVFMNAQDYPSDDKAKDAKKLGIGPSTPHYTLDLKFTKRAPLQIQVYDYVKDKQPRLYAELSDRDYIAALEHLMTDKFTKKPESFRFNRLITAAEKQGVTRVELKLPKEKVAKEGSFEFKQDLPGKWTLASGKIEMFDGSTVDAALNKIGAARIAEFMGKKPIPQGNGELSAWKLFDKDGKALREFAIYGNIAKGDYYVKMSTGETGKLDRGSGAAVPHWLTDFVHVPAPPPVAGGKPPVGRPPMGQPMRMPPGGFKLPNGMTLQQQKK